MQMWMLEDGGRNKKLTWALRHKIVEPGPQEEPLQQIASPLRLTPVLVEISFSW
jgi:hypothetical protein